MTNNQAPQEDKSGAMMAAIETKAKELHALMFPGMSVTVEWPASKVLVPGQQQQKHIMIVTRPSANLRLMGR